MPELRVTGGTILTMDPAGTVIADGLRVAAGGRLTSCGPRADAPPAGPGARTLEAGGGLILPGMVNCHTHAAMTLLRGLADDLPLDRWLNEQFPGRAAVSRAAVRWGHPPGLCGCSCTESPPSANVPLPAEVAGPRPGGDAGLVGEGIRLPLAGLWRRWPRGLPGPRS